MSSQVTKWGIASAGKISHDFASAVRSIPGNEHEFVAIAARSLEDAQKFAKTHEIPTAYGSYEELAKDNNVQVVYIGSIHPTHITIGKLMLEHGKHLLIEKPLTLNAKGSLELITLAKANKLFLMEAVWSRFLPAYRFMMDQLNSGVIGDVMHVNVTFGLPNAEVERVKRKSLGGGAILDIGIYTLNLVEMVFNGEKPEKISGVGHLNEEGCDVSLSAGLKFSAGKTASIGVHAKVRLPNEAFIVGTKGTIKLPSMFHCADKVYVNEKLHEFPMPETILPCNYENSSGLRYQAMEVRKCLLAGKLESEVMTQNDSLLLAKLEDEFRSQLGVKYDADQ